MTSSTVRVKRPVITVRLEPTTGAACWNIVGAIDRLQSVLSTLSEQYPDLKIKGVSVS